MADEISIPEPIPIQDTPEFKLEDLAGDYKIITQRVKDIPSKINTYETRVILNGTLTFLPEFLEARRCYKLEIAVEQHDSKVQELTEMSTRG